MILIKHRINSIKELKKTNQKYGVEIDVRSKKNRLFLNHDPFKDGVDFDIFLKNFKHDFLVVNVKEEGLELKKYSLIQKVEEQKIDKLVI